MKILILLSALVLLGCETPETNTLKTNVIQQTDWSNKTMEIKFSTYKINDTECIVYENANGRGGISCNFINPKKQ